MVESARTKAEAERLQGIVTATQAELAALKGTIIIEFSLLLFNILFTSRIVIIRVCGIDADKIQPLKYYLYIYYCLNDESHSVEFLFLQKMV